MHAQVSAIWSASFVPDGYSLRVVLASGVLSVRQEVVRRTKKAGNTDHNHQRRPGRALCDNIVIKTDV